MIHFDVYTEAIAELSLSGSISLGKCSRSTAYRWAREINQRLKFENCDWSVKLDLENRCLEISDVPAEQVLAEAERKRGKNHDQK